MARLGVQPRFIPTRIYPTSLLDPLPTSSDIFQQPTDTPVSADPSDTPIRSTQFSISDGTFSTSLGIDPNPLSSSTLIEPQPTSTSAEVFSSSDQPSNYNSQGLSTSMVISNTGLPNPTSGSAFSTSSQLSASATYVSPVDRAHHGGLSPGAIAAAVVVPVVAIAGLFLLAFICLRRRKRAERNQDARVPITTTAEKKSSWSNWRNEPIPSSGIPPVAAAPEPIVTSSQNNAYYTGLDTSSHGSRSIRGVSDEYYRRGGSTDLVEPPPPYMANKTRSSPPRSKRSTMSSSTAPQLPPLVGIPALREPSPSPPHSPTLGYNGHNPSEIPRGPSPFDDPPHHQATNTYLSTPPTIQAAGSRPGTSRSDTARSFTSTLYSDSASVHSARAERVSTALPRGDSLQGTFQLMPGTGGYHQRFASDPFADARGTGRDSPVSPIEDDGVRRWSQA